MLVIKPFMGEVCIIEVGLHAAFLILQPLNVLLQDLLELFPVQFLYILPQMFSFPFYEAPG